MKKRRPEPVPTDPRPRVLQAEGQAVLEIFARDRAGEFEVWAIDIGPRPGQYTCHLRYRKEYHAQLELLPD